MKYEDGECIGIDNDGNAIRWNVDTQRGENDGDPPEEKELLKLDTAKR